MKVLAFSLILFAAAAALGQDKMPPPAKTNNFVVHLQEGFYPSNEVVIAIDGREIYKGTPKTSPILGLAKMIPATSTSSVPVLTFTIPSRKIRWSKQIDLASGSAVGISVAPNGAVTVRQAKEFGYD